MSFTHEHSFTLAAAPAAAYAALTDAAQLRRWFAEHAEPGREVGAPFRFWGRHTLDTPTAHEATQHITRWEPANALGFTWTIGGVPTEVTIVLNGDDASTRALLRHHVQGELDRPRAKELIYDHWCLAFGNLATHLAGGAGIVLPDYNDPNPEVRQVVLIDAPRSVVFRCLTEPALINQWFGTASSVVEPHVGGRFDLNWRYEHEGRPVEGGPKRIIEFVQDEKLVLDWPDWRGDKSVTGQTISFALESIGDATRLTFVHAGFGRAADIGDYPFGWVWFLSELTKVACGNAPKPATGTANA